jgi:3D (Asp-Asp-Asp) domain-containing protein
MRKNFHRMEITLMRRNALTFTFPAYAVLLVLVLLSAVGKADEKHSTAATASPLLLVSSLEVPASEANETQELLHDDAVSSAWASAPRVLKMEVTAYCPCKKCCGKNAHGVTASGLHVTHNAGLFVAADAALLPFHTKLLIPGYAKGKAVPVLDRGGAIKGNRLDVFFPTHEQALKWGRRTIDVTITP